MTSVNKKEIEKFSKMAEEWWDPNGKFKPLHKFNPIRIRYIKDNIINHFNLKDKNKPLNKINILDIGCGGGLLSEPMSRLGAHVVGIDALEKNIKIAKMHANKNNLKIDYKSTSPEKLKTNKKFDVILNMEIIEHVEDINFFIKASHQTLRYLLPIDWTILHYLHLWPDQQIEAIFKFLKIRQLETTNTFFCFKSPSRNNPTKTTPSISILRKYRDRGSIRKNQSCSWN